MRNQVLLFFKNEIVIAHTKQKLSYHGRLCAAYAVDRGTAKQHEVFSALFCHAEEPQAT